MVPAVAARKSASRPTAKKIGQEIGQEKSPDKRGLVEGGNAHD